MKITTPSLEFFKPTLATTLAIVLAWLLSVRPAQAGYTVTLQQVGPDVVATGRGIINLKGLTFVGSGSPKAAIMPGSRRILGAGVVGPIVVTGPTTITMGDFYGHTQGPTSFGSVSFSTSASSGSGDIVGIAAGGLIGNRVIVPKGYVSGTALSDSAIYGGATLASLGVIPGTYVWKWGKGANQNFTLKILGEILPGPNITNISTRASVQTGPEVTIAGFIITGTGSKSVVVRGLGPTLAQFNVSEALADPGVILVDSNGHVLYTNDNWKTNSDGTNQQSQVQATGLAPANDLESAIVATLNPGSYYAILAGKNNTTGIGLVEVYDTSTDAFAELTNISTRGFVGTGDNVMIGGFIANGSNQVVVRGLGPTLTQFGVTAPLADPVVTLVDGNGNVVQTNNNWKDIQQDAISATGKAPPNDLEAAILAPVAAGNYTAILSGNGGGTGIGLVEVYKLP